MDKTPLNILLVASEAAPLAKTGGLADVAGSLAVALSRLGCRVTVMLPAYREAMDRLGPHRLTLRGLPVPMGPDRLSADVLVGGLAPGVPVCLVRHDPFFDRDGLYGDARGDYPDNAERFIFFSRSVPEVCRASGLEPDVILANDWQTGLVMALLSLGTLPRTAGVFTIHNMGYAGRVPMEKRSVIDLPESFYTMEGLEFYGSLSLLKAGIVYADAVTTVSPAYAAEIQTPEHGAGLDGLMRSVKDRLYGILNGVDYGEWDPSADPHLPARYSIRDLSGKGACKRALLREMGLPAGRPGRPLAGMVTRLAEQKGCRLVLDAAGRLFSMGLDLVILGEGEARYHRAFSRLRDRYPENLGIRFGFDPALAHRIIAGCDMFLMPSLYEPCGLTQMYSLRYGTLPVVRAVGGLRDTVVDPDDGKGVGTGFRFERFHADGLAGAVRRAAAVFRDRAAWSAMMRAAMSQDFSWERSAGAYLDVFRRAAAVRRRTGRA